MAKKRTYSIRANILANFLIILCIIFGLYWILEVVFFDTIFYNIKSKEVERTMTQAVEYFNAGDEDSLLELSVTGDCNIVIFSTTVDETGMGINIAFNSSRVTDPVELNAFVRLLISELGDKETVSYLDDRYEDQQVLILGYCDNSGEQPVYYYVSGVVTAAAYTTNVIVYLLLIIMSISLVVTVICSYFASMHLAKPIRNIADQAKLLSEGDLNVKFENREYKEISELSDTLNYAIAEIQKAESLRKEVMANVSHELRTPLTMIKSYAELINDINGNDPKKRAENIKVILEEADRLEYLVNDILDLSKMQAGTISYNFERFNISESLEKFEQFYKEKYTDFTFTFEYPKRVYLLGDKKRIEQVIINLLNNAINYSYDKKEITLRLFKVSGEHKYRLEVTDKGSGIDKAEQKYIFDRHFRATNSRRAVTGSGIGLSIVKEILTYHNFNFGVESEVGKGSTFYFEF